MMMAEEQRQRARFLPDRYHREAARVCREAEEADNDSVRKQLLEIGDRFDAVARTMKANLNQ